MATSDFLPFATGAGSNVISQATYASLTAQQTGFQAGVANSAQLNKVWRQSSIMAAVLAQFSVDLTGQNAVDDGTLATLLANLKAAIRLQGTPYAGAAGGTGNALTATLSPAPTAYTDSMIVIVRVALANTGAVTLNVNGLGPLSVVGAAHQNLQGGELVPNGFACFAYSTALGCFLLVWSTGGAEQVAPATQSQHAVQLSQALAMRGNLSGITSITTSSSVTASQIGSLIALGGTGTNTLTLPAPSSCPTGAFWINSYATTWNIVTPSGNFNGAGIFGTSLTLRQAQSVIIISDGLNWVIAASGGFSSTAPAGDSSTKNATTAFVQTTIQNAASIYAQDSGAANAYAVTLSPAPTALVDGMMVSMSAKSANTGPSTLNVNGLGAIQIFGALGAMQGGEIVANGNYLLQYNASLNAWRIVGQSGGTLTISPSTQSNQAVNQGQTFGVAQTLTNVTGSRSAGTTYTNSTGKPIVVYAYGVTTAANGYISLTIGGNPQALTPQALSSSGVGVSGVIPAGATYQINTGSATLNTWFELR